MYSVVYVTLLKSSTYLTSGQASHHFWGGRWGVRVHVYCHTLLSDVHQIQFQPAFIQCELNTPLTLSCYTVSHYTHGVCLTQLFGVIRDYVKPHSARQELCCTMMMTTKNAWKLSHPGFANASLAVHACRDMMCTLLGMKFHWEFHL